MDTLPEPTGRGRPGKKTQFAKSIGWAYTAMLNTERQPEKSIPLKAIIGICKVYKVDANWLLLGSTTFPTKTP